MFGNLNSSILNDIYPPPNITKHTMDPFRSSLGGGDNDTLDRELAMRLIQQGVSAQEAVSLARQAAEQQQQQQRQAQESALASAAGYNPDMLRLQRDLLDREIAARAAALPSFNGVGLNMAAQAAQQHPPFSSLLPSAFAFMPPGSSMAGASAALQFQAAAAPLSVRRNSPPLSPSLKPDSGGIGTNAESAVGSLKRAAALHRDSLGSNSDSGSNKRARLSSFPPSPPSAFSAVPQQQQKQLSAAPRRGSKAKLRDDFWGKVGKNNSHIHLVNIVLGRLLHDQVSKSKGGNKVLSNDLIQQILEHKLYGKYAVKDFFASSNKASETVRNTWTRLNFASDDIRKGLSRYKEQTWQAIERCGFEDASEEDTKEMDDALKVFVSSGRFVAALDVALKGIITEAFMGVLMQLRIEWNGLCLHCRPEEHDTVVASFLRKYGLNGK